MSPLGPIPSDSHDSNMLDTSLDHAIVEPQKLEIADLTTLSAEEAHEIAEVIREKKMRSVVFKDLVTIEPAALRTLDLWDPSLVSVDFPALTSLTGDNLSGVAAFEASAPYVGRREVTFGSSGLRSAVDNIKEGMAGFGGDGDPTGYLAHAVSRAVGDSRNGKLDTFDYLGRTLNPKIAGLLSNFQGSTLYLNSLGEPVPYTLLTTILGIKTLKRLELGSIAMRSESTEMMILRDHIEEFRAKGGTVIVKEESNDVADEVAETAAAVQNLVVEPVSALVQAIEDANEGGQDVLVYHAERTNFTEKDSEDIGRFLGTVIELRDVERFEGNSFTTILSYPQNLKELRISRAAYGNLDDGQRDQIGQPNFHDVVVKVVEYDGTIAVNNTHADTEPAINTVAPNIKTEKVESIAPEVPGEPGKVAGKTRSRVRKALLGAAGIFTIMGAYTSVSNSGEKSSEKAPVVAKASEAEDLVLSGKTKLDDSFSFSTVDEYVKKGYVTLDKDGTPWPAEGFAWKNPDVPLDLSKPETLAVVRCL